MKTLLLPLTLTLSVLSLLCLSGCGSKAIDVPSSPDVGKSAANQAVAPSVGSAQPVKEKTPPVVATPAGTPSPNLLAFESNWKYSLSPQGYEGEWRTPGFDDSAWSSGKTPIGYGDNDLGTKLNDAEHKGKTLMIRARTTFQIGDPAAYGALRVRIMRDDGIVLYLNGVELARDNLPATALKANSMALKALSGAAESEYLDIPLPAAKLVAGTNVVAVAVHQNNVKSSDLWFDIELTAEVR